MEVLKTQQGDAQKKTERNRSQTRTNDGRAKRQLMTLAKFQQQRYIRPDRQPKHIPHCHNKPNCSRPETRHLSQLKTQEV